ncbi:unnamed protein product [Pieris brassicae]|uniref:Uncharacterized protein n=1 Tax=Pieris brassicae TaxID=7116 RepID=A0A9P0TFL6_PIEBR|nr:unnamed protein product [Pieris brassicae]
MISPVQAVITVACESGQTHPVRPPPCIPLRDNLQRYLAYTVNDPTCFHSTVRRFSEFEFGLPGQPSGPSIT